MFWFLCFKNPFTNGERKIRNPTYGDEFMMGKWTIHAYDIENNEQTTNYSVVLMPHMTEDALIGNITWTSDENTQTTELIFRFHGWDRDRFTAFYMENGQEKLLSNVVFDWGDDNLLVAYGKIENSNISYSINMFTETSLEVTTFDRENKEFTLYRASKPDLRPKPNPLKKYFYAAMIIAYIYFRRKDQEAREAAQQNNDDNNKQNTANNGNTQNKGSNHKKNKKKK